MILIDYNHVMIANIMAQIGDHSGVDIQVGMVRHMVLNTIRKIRTRFFGEFGELVLCCDSGNYWRKQMFPFYKATRKKARQKDTKIDWNQIYLCLNTIREELAENTPYTVIHVDTVEADDIITVLATDLNPSKSPTLIISGDKDFVQLQRNSWIKQYAPVEEKWVVPSDTVDKVLLEHIIRGDRGDGIPNILSDDDTFVVETKRQRKITEKYLKGWLDDPDQTHVMTDVEKKNFLRNSALIDLRQIPLPIRTAIITSTKQAHKLAAERDRHNLMKYFIDNRLKTLMESIGDF